MQIKNILKQSAVVLILITIVSKVLGFARELVIANYFGTSNNLDTFLLAFTIPNIIISITMYAYPNSIIPKLGKKDNPEYNRLIATIIRIYFIVSIVIGVGLFIGANFIASILMKDNGSYDIQVITQLIRYLSFYTLFFNTFNILKSIYQSEKKFVFPAITQLSVHLVLILSVVFFSKEYGYYSLVWGVVGGTLLQLLIILFDFIPKHNFYYLFNYEKNIKIFDITFITLVSIEIINQIYLFIDRYYASSLPEGSISSLNYANILTQLPISIFALSVGIVIFTKMRDNANDKKAILDKFLLKKIIAIILLFSVPSFILFFIFPEYIIRIIFMRGQFDYAAVKLTVNALKYFSIGIPFVMIHVILTKYFFVIQKPKYVLISNFVAFLIKVIIINTTILTLKHAALALSTSVAFIVNISVLSIFLAYKPRKNAII